MVEIADQDTGNQSGGRNGRERKANCGYYILKGCDSGLVVKQLPDQTAGHFTSGHRELVAGSHRALPLVISAIAH
jgi:hypothetical protein